MTVNIIGPHGAGINETYTRPDDTASGVGYDSWFKDCVGGVAGTGTKIPAVWLNKVIAQLREAIRGMGVAENELDDQMLLKAITAADRPIINLGAAGLGLYAGLNVYGQHPVRKLAAGANITVTQLAGGEVEIAAAAPGGAASFGNIGSGEIVYKGLNGSTHEFKRIKSGGGCTVDTDSDAVRITVAGSGGTTLPAGSRVLVGDGQITLGSNVAVYGAATPFTGTHTPANSGNDLFIDGVIDIKQTLGANSNLYLDVLVDVSTDGGSTFTSISTTKRVSVQDNPLYGDTFAGYCQAVIIGKATTAGSPVQIRCRVETGANASSVLAGSRIRVMEYKTVA